MDVKLVNPFIDAFTTVLPQMGFPTPQRTGMTVNNQNAVSQGVAVIVGFTKEIRGNVVYNMSEDTAKFIASTMMMGNAATNLTALGLEVDISTPSLTVGSDFQIKISNEQYLCVVMDISGHQVEIDIAVQQ